MSEEYRKAIFVGFFRADTGTAAGYRFCDSSEVAYFTKKFARPYHRIGDQLMLQRTDKGAKAKPEVVGHVNMPEEEARSRAVELAVKAERKAKKLANKSDLEDALYPVLSAMRDCNKREQAALISWVVTYLFTGTLKVSLFDEKEP